MCPTTALSNSNPGLQHKDPYPKTHKDFDSATSTLSSNLNRKFISSFRHKLLLNYNYLGKLINRSLSSYSLSYTNNLSRRFALAGARALSEALVRGILIFVRSGDG